MIHSFVPRIVRPRIENGTDYSGERWVLVRLRRANGSFVKELRWFMGGTFWASAHEPSKHVPTQLQIVTWAPSGREIIRKISSGGRLSKSVLSALNIRAAVEAEFGLVAVKELTTVMDIRYQTLLIEETPQ